jgi:Pectate lyase superfamily protein
VAVFTPTAFTAAAINTAITNAANAGGGSVYCAAGVYTIDTPIILKSMVQVIGDGPRATSFRQASSTNLAKIVEFYRSPDGSIGNGEFSALKSVKIDGNKSAGNTSVATNGVDMVVNPLWSNATNDLDPLPFNRMSDVHIWNCHGDGYKADGRSADELTRIYCQYNDGNGMVITADSNVHQCNMGLNGLAGYLVAYNASIIIEGCYSWGNGLTTASAGHGFAVVGNTTGTVRISGIAQDNKAAGLYVDGSVCVIAALGCDSNSASSVGGAYPAVQLVNSTGCNINATCIERLANTGRQIYALKCTGSTGNVVRATNQWVSSPASAARIDPGSTTTNNDLYITSINAGTPTTTRVTMS